MKLLHKRASVVGPNMGTAPRRVKLWPLSEGERPFLFLFMEPPHFGGSDQTPAGGIKTSSPLVKKQKTENDIRFLKIEQEDF